MHLILNCNFNNIFKTTLFGMPTTTTTTTTTTTNREFNDRFQSLVISRSDLVCLGGAFFMCSLPLTLEPGYATERVKCLTQSICQLVLKSFFNYYKCAPTNKGLTNDYRQSQKFMTSGFIGLISGFIGLTSR